MNAKSSTSVNWQIKDPTNRISAEIESIRKRGSFEIKRAVERTIRSASSSTAMVEQNFDFERARICELGQFAEHLADDYYFGLKLVSVEDFGVDEATRKFDELRPTWIDRINNEQLRLTKLHDNLLLPITEYKVSELERDKKKTGYYWAISVGSAVLATVASMVALSLIILVSIAGVICFGLAARRYHGPSRDRILEMVVAKRSVAVHKLEVESNRNTLAEDISKEYAVCIYLIENASWKEMFPNTDIDSIRRLHLSAESQYDYLMKTVAYAVAEKASSQVFERDFIRETEAMVNNGDLTEEAYRDRVKQYLTARQPLVERTTNEEALKEFSRVIKRYLTSVKQHTHQSASASGISLRRLEESIAAATDVRSSEVDLSSEDLDSLARIVVGAGAIGGGILSGGAGVALIASGPIGWIAGAAIAGLALTQGKSHIKSMLGAMGFGLTEEKVRDHFSAIESSVRASVAQSVNGTCRDIQRHLSHIQESIETTMIEEFRATAHHSTDSNFSRHNRDEERMERRRSSGIAVRSIHQIDDTDIVLWSEISNLIHISGCKHITKECREVPFASAKPWSNPCPYCLSD